MRGYPWLKQRIGQFIGTLELYVAFLQKVCGFAFFVVAVRVGTIDLGKAFPVQQNNKESVA